MIKYFDKVAKEYNKKSNRFPWLFIRKYESYHLLSLVEKKNNLKVLDLGCGSGYYSKIFSRFENNKVFAIDSSREMVESIKDENIIKYQSDAAKINLNDKFNLIICAGLLEFVPSINDILLNAKNHSNSNTNMLALIPKKNLFGKIYKMYHSNHNININLFTYKQLKKIFYKNGWKIIKYKDIFPFTIIIHCKLY